MKFIWDIIEKINACIFKFRYGKKCLNIQKVLSKYQKDYNIREAKTDDIDSLVAFFQAMQRFIDEPNLIAKMKVNARPMVIDRFEQKYIWNELLKVYQSFDE